MSLTPDDILAEARELLAGADGEARCRSVVSRAYYAAFHAAWWFAAGDLGLTRRPHSSAHGQVTRFLAGHEEKIYRECAALLIRLRDLRNKADRHLNVTVSRGLAEDAVADAAEIIEEMLARRP